MSFKYSPSGNNSQKTSSAVPPGPPVYVDLAYVPNHCSAKNVDQEFFKRVRASYYVVSGNDPGSGEPSRGVLDALLEGKSQWGSNLQVFTLNLSACASISLISYQLLVILFYMYVMAQLKQLYVKNFTTLP